MSRIDSNTTSPDTSENLKRLLTFFPAINTTYNQSGRDIGQISDENQKNVAHLIHEVSSLLSAGELNEILPPNFSQFSEKDKTETLKNIYIHLQSRVITNPSATPQEKAKAYVSVIPIVFSKKHIQEPIDQLPNFEEKSHEELLENISAINPGLVILVSNNLINQKAVKTVACRLNQNEKWQLDEEQMDELVSFFPSAKKTETSEEYIQRLVNLQRNASLPGKTSHDVKAMLEELTMLILIEAEVEIGLQKRHKPTPKNNTAYDQNIYQVSQSILQEIERLKNPSNIIKGSPEIREVQRMPTKISDLRDLIGIVDANPDIKAVSFDLMETVIFWENQRLVRQNEFFTLAIQVLKKHGINVDFDEFVQIHGVDYQPRDKEGVWYKMRGESFASADGYELTFQQLMRAVLEKVCLEKGLHIETNTFNTALHDLERAYVHNEARTVLPMPFAKETLEELKKRGLTIVLLSNAIENEAAIGQYLQKAGLFQYFDQINVSCEAGYQKTGNSDRFYKHMLGDLGLPAQQVLHTGDNKWTDYEGPRKAGLHAVHYVPKHEIEDVIRDKHNNYGNPNPEKKEQLTDDLALKRRAQFKERMDLLKIPEHERAELSIMADRMYEISRDYYSPAAMGFAIELLNELKDDPEQLNICTGRDSLMMYIHQRLLLRKFPGEFGNIDPKRVQFLPFSRRLLGGQTSLSSGWRDELAKKKPWINTQDESRFKRYLDSAGFDKFKKICLVDNGIDGTSQDELTKRFPDKNIKGKYLASKIKTPAEKKQGYFTGYDYSARSFNGANKSQFGNRYKLFLKLKPICLLEDFFNGIQTSSEHFTGSEAITKSGKSVPRTNRRNLGINEHETKSKLIKLVALWGMMDAVEMHGEEIIHDQEAHAAERVDKLVGWIHKMTQPQNGREWVRTDTSLTPELQEDARTNPDAKLLKLLWDRVPFMMIDDEI